MDQNSSSSGDALWQQANALATAGDLLGAVPLYLELSDIWPEQAAVWLNLGIVLGGLHRHAEAKQCLERAVEMDPGNPHSQFQLGQMHEQLGALEAAARSYLCATELDLRHFDAWHSLAEMARKNGDDDLVEQYLQEILRAEPDHAAGNFSLGNLRQKQGDLEGAAHYFSIAYKLTNDPACGNNLAGALEGLGRVAEAINILHDLLQARPDFMLAWNTLGGLYMQTQQYREAREALLQALSIDDNFHAARHGLARCLVQMHDLSGARAQFERLTRVLPDEVMILKEYALVLENLGDFQEALTARQQAMKLAPSDAHLMADQANLLRSQSRFDEAIALAQKALTLDPNELRANVTIAAATVDQKLKMQHISTVLDSGTQNTIILGAIAGMFEQHKNAAAAIIVYQNILAISPDDSNAAIRIFDLKMGMCDWTDYEAICQSQVDQIEAGFADTAEEGGRFDVFNLQALPVSYEFIAKTARHAAANIAADARMNLLAPDLVHAAPQNKKAGDGRIRLGYALGYTWFHSLPLVLEEIVKRHDRDRFEVFGYSVKPGDDSDFSANYRAAFDHFKDIPEAAPYLAAQMINDDGIDVLIDVTGLTSINCMPISSFRPAPVQMHGYGYSITTGADYIDYLITDRTYIPEAWENLGPEKMLYLPNTFMPTKRPEAVGAPVSRKDVGLPEDAIVFCNFNHPCKFEPVIFAAWMEILKKVPDSVLWFGAWMDDTQGNLRREAAKHGVDAERLIFSEIVEHQDHLARLALVDLALDNLHHGGGITSVDALWVGLPVLSILGDKPGARLGATLCNAAGIPEMVMPDLASYVERAVALANDGDEREALRQRLLDGRDSQPLFDNARYGRNLDNAIAAAWHNHLAGRPPERIELGE
jgi:predicted O-linked N-acetylglucosamine transferase (SPINDLY family)